MSIRLRLTLWYSTILTVTLLIFGVAIYFISYYILISDQKAQMRKLSLEIRDQIIVIPFTFAGDKTVYRVQLPSLDEFKYSNYFIQAINQKDEVVGSSYRFALPLPTRTDTPFLREKVGNASFLVFNDPVSISTKQGSQVVMVLQIAVIINDIDTILKTLQYVLLLLGIVTVVLAATLGWFLARKALKPIDNVIAAAAQIEKGADLGMRIPYAGPEDEIGRLTNTINGMLGRIQSAYTELEDSNLAQRRFVSDASHELRTPLTTIRGNVDLLEKMWRQLKSDTSAALDDPEKLEMSLEAMRDIAGEAARMSRLVNDLLSLARADAGFQMVKEPVLIRPLVEEVARRAQLLPKSADWQVGDLSVLEGISVNGNRDYLQQLLFIFIENAFKYTPQGHVRLDALRQDDQVGIRISDTGIGMDKEEVPHIFERFYRADLSRGKTSGTGLGLSIAKWIIDEHNGSVEVTTRKDHGSTFVVWLPILFYRDDRIGYNEEKRE